MALCKTFVQENGISTSYHKITDVTVRTEETNDINLRVFLTSYMDKTYREKDQPINTDFYSFEISGELEESMSIRKLAYNQLRTLEKWSDAEDC